MGQDGPALEACNFRPSASMGVVLQAPAIMIPSETLFVRPRILLPCLSSHALFLCHSAGL